MMYTASRLKELDKSLKNYRQNIFHKNKDRYINNKHKHKLISQHILLLHESLNILNPWHKKVLHNAYMIQNDEKMASNCSKNPNLSQTMNAHNLKKKIDT